MKNKMILIICVLMLVAGCGGGSNSPEGGIGGTGEAALKAPSSSSLNLDIELLSVSSTGKKASGSNNMTRAREVANGINNNVRSFLKRPKAILEKISTLEPSLNSNNQSEWSFDLTHENETFSVKVIGYTEGGQVFWNIYQVNDGLDTLWFSGVSEEDGLSGFWDVYRLNETNDVLLTVTWSLEDSATKLTIQILDSTSDKFGNSVEFEEVDHQATCLYYRLIEDNVIEMAWNQESGVGGIRDPELNDGVLSRWDVDLADLPNEEVLNIVPSILSADTLEFVSVENKLGGFSANAGSNFLQGLSIGTVIDGIAYNESEYAHMILSDAVGVTRTSTGANGYLWSWSGTADGISYDANLGVKTQGVYLRWKLWVKTSDDLTQSLILQGFTNSSGDKGMLQLVSKFDLKLQMISFDISGESKTKIYRDINRLNRSRGDYVKLIESTEEVKIRYFDVSSIKLYSLIWSQIDFSGYVKDPDYLNGEKALWDTLQKDL